MSAEYEVKVASAGNQVLVVDAIARFPSQMRETHHHVAPLLLLEDGCYGVGCHDGVTILHVLAVGLGHQALQLGTYADEPDAHPVDLDDVIGAHESLHDGAREVIVGGHDGKLGHGEDAHHVVEAEVELVIAYGGHIVANDIHHHHLGCSLEEVVVERALREVATVDQQCLGIVLAHLLHEGGSAHIAAQPRLAVGLDAAVCVARVEDGQMEASPPGLHQGEGGTDIAAGIGIGT